MFDFKKDLLDEIINAAEEMGFRISEKRSFDDALIDYLTVRFKFIDAKVRRTVMSPPLLKDLFTHPKRDVIEDLFYLSKSGQDLNVFQSKKLLQSKFHNHMLNSWKIHHFHLSSKKDGKSDFVKQGNELLFVYIDDDNALFLGVDKHRDGVFADQKWLEILHDYFPEIMEPLKVKGALDLSHHFNATERQSLWDKGINTGMTKIKGTIYFGPGFGGMASGHGHDVVRTANKIHRWINKLNKQFKEDYNHICKGLNVDENSASFKIRFNGRHLSLFETNTSALILNFPEYFKIEKN